MRTIILPEPLYSQIVRHARQEAPREAVGMIAGSSNGVAAVVQELPNLGNSREFFADPYAQYHAESCFERDGLRIIAIYHSHPGGGTDLSAEDRLCAARWLCAQLVIVPERASNDSEQVRAYRMVSGRPHEVPIRRVPAGRGK